MFTIRHATPYGNETIIETDEISYCPHAEPEPRGSGFNSSTGTLWYQSHTTDQLVPIKDGQVYIMNEAGSTVAKYDLGGWAQPA